MEASADRMSALRALGPDGVAALLRRVPALAEAVEGHGPLARPTPLGHRPSRAPHDTLDRLARLLATPAGVHATLTSLTRFELQLATLARWHGGSLTREDALAEAGEGNAAALEAAAETLARLVLTDPEAGWVALRPGVPRGVGLPGVPIRPSLEATASDALAQILRNLGHPRPPTRKHERVDALEARLRDPDTVRRLVKELDEDSLRVFGLLLEHGPQSVADLGVAHFLPWRHQDTPLHSLAALGLAGVSEREQVAWVWLDVIVAVTGRLFPDWPSEAPAATPAPLTDPGHGVPPVLGRLSTLLAGWAADPAPTLAEGGLGVRPVRAAAKSLGVDSGEAGLLAHLAIELGLLGTRVTATTGTGRNRSEHRGWAPTELHAEFEALPAPRRWALLVQAWRRADALDETDGLPERFADLDSDPVRELPRAALLDLLAELPAGHGLAEDDLLALADHRAPSLLPPATTQGLVAAARALGLVPATGPVGLTAVGRALLDGVDALEAALPAAASEFVVQADHTVIAPPDLDPEVATRLERYAETESSAGARVHRLAERRLAAALDQGESADEILGFLAAHASTELPQNVDYLVRDVERRHGRVRVGEARAYVCCDDPALLARAAEVKPAKLRLLAPTVAVSELPVDKVIAALRQRGLMPRAEDADGVALDPAASAATATPARHTRGRLRELSPLPLGGPPAGAETQAAALLDADDDPGSGPHAGDDDPLSLEALEWLLDAADELRAAAADEDDDLPDAQDAGWR